MNKAKGPTMSEYVDIYLHSHADTGGFLGRDWSDPPSERLDIVGMHMDHAIDLILGPLDDQESELSREIDGLVAEHWPAWADKCVRFFIDWESDGQDGQGGYYVVSHFLHEESEP